MKHKKWTEKEIEFLKQNYPQKTIDELTKIIKVDRSVIRYKLFKIGLVKKKKRQKIKNGDKFGRLTVISKAEKIVDGKACYLCLCKCGKEKIIMGRNLLKRGTKSCGCLQKEINVKRCFRDLSGKTFSKLYVIKCVGKKENRGYFYQCRCKCGRITNVQQSHLVSYHTQSCGKCNISNGETQVKNTLEKLKVKYEQQKTFEGCKNKKKLRFDFYLPDYNLCIEYQGMQHYCKTRRKEASKQLELIKKCDKIKRDFCQNNNIKLLEIKYTDFNKIEETIEKILKEDKI